MKITDLELTLIGNAVRSSLADSKDKTSIEDTVRSVFAIKCDNCGHWTDRVLIPQSVQARSGYVCVECCTQK